MPFFEAPTATIHINAPPERVMAMLADLESYPAWMPFTTRMDGALRVGATITEHVQLTRGSSARRLQRVVVTAVEPDRLDWHSEMLGSRALLFARRTQTVTREGAGCVYFTRDTMTGLLAPLVLWLYGRVVREGFEAQARALKARAEG